MTRALCTFRQRDVVRALKALATAGMEGRVEIARDGRIIIIPGKQEPVSANEWDSEYGPRQAQIR